MQEDLLRAVLDAPDDPAPRLVYADALMRAGDPRGEFIALQCAGKPEAAALLEAHRAAWVRRLPHISDAYFERGFVTAASLVCDDENPAPALAALDREPIRSLAVVLDSSTEDSQEIDLASKASWIVSDPRIGRIHAFDLTQLAWGAHALAILLDGSPALRELHIGDDDCTPAELALIAAKPLTTLGVRGDYAATFDDHIRIFVDAPIATSLRTLSLDSCNLTARGAQTIASAIPNLRHLSLNSTTPRTANQIGDAGALALASSPHLSHLWLANNRLTDAFLAALADGNLAPSLRSFAIDGCHAITSAGFAAFVSSPRFADLEYLSASGCNIHDDGIAALARSSHARALRGISLQRNAISLEGARLLADSPLATQLEYLQITVTPSMEAVLRPAFGDRLNPAG